MAKEFKRSGSKDFKGKKTFGAKKGRGADSDKKDSYSRERADDKGGKFAKKTSYGRSEDKPRSEEGFNRSEGEFKNDKPFEKKARPDKRDDQPAFKRFQDDSRPSDFGSPKKRSSSSFSDSRKKDSPFKPAFKKRGEDSEEKSSFREKGSDTAKPYNRKPFGDKPAFKKRRDDGDDKPSFRERGDDKPKSFGSKSFGDKPAFKKRRDDDKPSYKERGDDKPKSFVKRNPSDKPAFVRKSDNAPTNEIRESDYEYGGEKPAYTSESGRGFKKSKPFEKKTFSGKKTASKPQRETDDGLVRLNKYLSNAGICSRREADVLIGSGVVQVNGKTITEMGYRVKPSDIIKYGGQTLKKERLVYLVLNKPKDYITTADDPQERRTVLDLVQDACKERIYPVGRLDRATTGLLLLTNDGDLTKKLTHPRYGVRKIYHAELDKPLKRIDLDKIAEGLELEDGAIKVDEIAYVGDGADKTQIGVEIHSGKNRIVRRIFEHMGYNVRKLDRVMFGSLTKKDLPRGRWRLLTDAEVGMLKMISAEKV